MRKKKRKIKKVRFLALLMIFLSFLLAGVSYGKEVFLSDNAIEERKREQPAIEKVTIDLKSKSGYLIRMKDDEVLYDKAGEKKIYPASMTKIMTVYLAIQKLPDLNQQIVIPSSIIQGLEEEGSSMAGFMPMEKVSVKDLLYGALLPSGGDACETLALAISQEESTFVKLMNEEAKTLGMKDTHFMNTTGLHDRDHYSTAKDIAILLKKALENKTFYTIFTTMQYTTTPDQFYPTGIHFTSTLLDGLEEHGLSNPYIIGAKTGYTPEAGLCMASLANIEKEAYLFVSANAQGDHETPPYHIQDALNIFQALAKG